MVNSDIKKGMTFICNETLGEWYTEGNVYVSMADGTIRDNLGYDYDVLLVDRYFRKIKDENIMIA